MFSVNKYFFFFLCLYTAKFDLSESNELDNFIQNNVSVSNTDDDYAKKVTLFKENSIQYNILINISQIKKHGKEADDNINVFYLVLGCNFAEWTIMRINNFIRSFPLFYQRKFLNTEYDKAFINNYDRFIDPLKTIHGYLLKFICILQNVLDANSHVFYYDESTILKSFISLKIKITSYILLTQQLYMMSDEVIIQEMLEEMNVIQSFLIMNCDNIPLNNNNNSQIYGYLLTVQDVKSTDVILHSIQSSFNWESDFKNCFKEQIFLENIITTHSTEPGLDDIFKAVIKRVRGKVMTVKDILEKMSQLNDFEIIYWCKKSILIAIIKVIHCKILVLLSENSSLRTPVMKAIAEINAMVTKHIKKLPAYFVDGLQILTWIKFRDVSMSDEDYNMMVMKIKKYYDSIDDIELKCPIKIVKGDKIKLEHNDLINEDNKQIFIHNTYDHLNILMKKIIENFNDFICFYQYFKCPHSEFDKAYNTFPIKKAESKLQSVKTNTEPSNTCRFVLDLYLISYKTVIFLNRGIEKVNTNEYIQFFTKARDSISLIKNYLLKIIKMDTEDVDFLEVAHNIVIVLVNENGPIITTRGKHFKRIMYLVMAELNKYSFQYCTLPKFNFDVFSNVRFMDDNVKSVFENENFKNLSIEPQDYECFSYTFLYQTLIEKSKFLNPYKDIIHVYWRRKKRSVLEVFEELTHLNPFYLYALYDIYFKFHIAVIYYEVKREFTSFKQLFPNIKNNKNVIEWWINFPVVFAPLINNVEYIYDVLKNKSDLDESTINVVSQKCLEIEKQFKNFNFDFDFSNIQYNNPNENNAKKIKSLQNDYLKFVKQNDSVIQKVSNNIINLNECYVKCLPRIYRRVRFASKPAEKNATPHSKLSEIQQSLSGRRMLMTLSQKFNQ